MGVGFHEELPGESIQVNRLHLRVVRAIKPVIKVDDSDLDLVRLDAEDGRLECLGVLVHEVWSR